MRSVSSIASRSSPVRKWYLAISPRPQRTSRGGSVASASRSQTTPDGCQIRADQVLAADPIRGGEVDPGLAADRGVDHAEQRGRDVDDRDAAVPRRRGEPGDVGDHATADADHDVVAGQPESGEPAAQLLDRGERLVRLALTDGEHLGRHARVDVDRDAVLRDDGGPLGGRRQQPGQLAAARRDRPARRSCAPPTGLER